MDKYVCSIHILEILQTAITYWNLSSNWIILNNNLASCKDKDKQATMCVYTYPHENGPRINYIKGDIIKSAWINKDELNNTYSLTPRTIN